MPPNLIKDLFESRTTPELGWPQGKPLPDLEQFVDRSTVNEVLKEMGRKPGGEVKSRRMVAARPAVALQANSQLT